MIGTGIEAPCLTPGVRIEVDAGSGVLVCRLRAVDRATLQLAVPPGARRSLPLRDGQPLLLTMYHAGACLECDTAMRGWIWTRPPLLVVGPIPTWREKRLRAARRAQHQLAARLVTSDGQEHLARTQDVSAGGVSLIVRGRADIPEGSRGRLTLQIDDGIWCDDLPIRVARARHWLQSSGRTMEIGAELQISSELQNRQWQDCLRRLSMEE
jgi:hypothetical protein